MEVIALSMIDPLILTLTNSARAILEEKSTHRTGKYKIESPQVQISNLTIRQSEIIVVNGCVDRVPWPVSGSTVQTALSESDQ
jgi:hypothetical protein